MAWKTFIDISRWQGTVNFDKLKNSGVDALYMRAYQGTTRDQRLDEYSTGAKNVGLPFGLYTYWRPKDTAEEQINRLLQEHTKLGATLIPMIDVEHDDGHSPQFIGQHVTDGVRLVEEAIGRTPTIYTAAWFWNPKVVGAEVSRCPLWLARYTRDTPPTNPAQWGDFAMSKPQPAVPAGWSTWDAWQFSADGNNMGRQFGASSSHLDLNIMREESWIKFDATTPINKPAPVTITYHEDKEMRIVNPARVYDSRNVSHHGVRERRRIKVDSVTAAFVNITVVEPQDSGYLTAWSGVGDPPNVSNVNFSKGQTTANTSWIPVSNGHIDIFTSAACHVLVDLQAVT